MLRPSSKPGVGPEVGERRCRLLHALIAQSDSREERARGHRSGVFGANCLKFGLVIMVGQYPGKMLEKGGTESPGWQERNGPYGPSLLIA